MLTNDAPWVVQRTMTHASRDQEDKDKFFQPDRCMVSVTGKRLVSKLAEALLTYEQENGLRRRKRRPDALCAFHRIVEAIASDLIHSVLSGDDEKGIAISRSNRVLTGKSKYVPSYFGKQLPDVLDRLADTGFLRQELGHFNPFKDWHQRTLIFPDVQLMKLTAEYSIGFSDIGQNSDGQCIRLKDSSKKLAEYDDGDHPHIQQRREEMTKINQCLASARIEYQSHYNLPVDTSSRKLYRVFNHGSFESHGRMYGGFWIDMPQEERLAHLLIEGRPVVELDYGQMATRIAYGLVGVNPPEGDQYAIPGLEGYREGVKKVLNSMLNYEGSFKRKPKGTKALLPKQVDISTVQQMIRTYHHPIADYLNRNMGQKITFIESELMVSILLRLMNQGVVALPIHDCIIVREDHLESATEVMMTEFEKAVGVRAVINPESHAHVDG